MKNIRLNGYIYDFRIAYDIIAVADILDNHKYLMKNMGLHKLFGFVKQIIFSTMMFFGCNLSNVKSLM